MAEKAGDPLDALRGRYDAVFGRPPTFGARAPGRVNLIGEHTDYNEGWVLPIAIDRDTWVIGARGHGSRFRVRSETLGEVIEFDAGAPRRTGGWSDYLQGVVWALAERGVEVGGCDLMVGSQVLVGRGLSSSAALGVAAVACLDAALGLGWAPIDWARTALRAEREFVGVGCGIMDPFASALSRRGAALEIDCRSESWRSVAMPGEQLALVLADSGIRRALAAPDTRYGDRVAECRAALDAASGLLHEPYAALRDIPPAALPQLEARLDPTLFRRLRHVVSENARVGEVAGALEVARAAADAGVVEECEGALRTVGEHLCEGQRSLRDDFEVSTPELDVLCAIAAEVPGVYGSRLTGAGFGGCVLHLVAAAAVETLVARLGDGFDARFGRRPDVLEVHAADGASLLTDGV